MAREPHKKPARQPADEGEPVVHATAQPHPILLKRRGDVLEHLRTLLQSGKFPPGTRLPSERALAMQLGVGRPALREAIKALSILDLLESRRGAGTFVKAQDGLPAHWPEKPYLDGTQFELLELLEVRKMFEPRAAWLAAARALQNELREIEAARRALEAAGDDWQRVVDLDFEFHATIIRAAGNAVLTSIHEALTPAMLESRRVTARSVPDFSRMYRDHSAIVEAILKRQPDQAERAMLEHLHTVGMDLISRVRE
jgi:GntR family transcriptional repressor for pyruvate dehydrogenase complex